ncbi:hypothetical protein JQ557_25975 [Bradyrhizobium sp. U87765 SZCCT0131]|uniref:DUF6959 family protein n=1 Tax=unclassified Bradyrhizobium TaxID=2631580 RepID=UPI001BA954F7|nr:MULTISPECIES: hypothetical protein [unclassified Bradyrhizobium]MBR1221473.1 hypothetical protein [Bradyrhizobium sp. U87765 SZCCT0131]MBR1264604.1 hypothetical protein [Bradyrhizobium sp. U87765 SZCCT0134]MBR1304490.1 hypothetical protein [Bradyrhizobium sp. U87765 SZCCT0110]MBR1322653.1 hypothetical protein [Bradyrhizobium sp. U87765 SZCCT0109]MBR1346419.1 hypothetical protein [Bradyrhizobium sp. U87765 SZCCT0048]
MSHDVELLSRPVNFAVVKLAARSYPGVVFQGDTLNGLVQQLMLMSELLVRRELEELSDEIKYMHEQLSEALVYYEVVCAQHSIGLPYAKSGE